MQKISELLRELRRRFGDLRRSSAKDSTGGNNASTSTSLLGLLGDVEAVTNESVQRSALGSAFEVAELALSSYLAVVDVGAR